MQLRDPRPGLEEFQNGIFSNDPIEYNAVINHYVEPQASYSSGLIATHGAYKIKRLMALKKLLVRETKVDKRKSRGYGGTKWNEDSQTYFVPTLTTFGLPFALPFVEISFTFPTSLSLHLNINDDSRTQGSEGDADDGFMITKWEEKGPLDAILGRTGPTVRKLHTSLMRPITTMLLLLLAGAQHFLQTHPLSNGLFNFVLAAIAAVFTELRDIVLTELSSKSPRLVYQAESLALQSEGSSTSIKPPWSTVSTETTTRSRTSSLLGKNTYPARFRPSGGSTITTSPSKVNAIGASSQQPNQSSSGDNSPTFAKIVAQGSDRHHQEMQEQRDRVKSSAQETDTDTGPHSFATVAAEGITTDHQHATRFFPKSQREPPVTVDT